MKNKVVRTSEVDEDERKISTVAVYGVNEKLMKKMEKIHNNKWLSISKVSLGRIQKIELNSKAFVES